MLPKTANNPIMSTASPVIVVNVASGRFHLCFSRNETIGSMARDKNNAITQSTTIHVTRGHRDQMMTVSVTAMQACNSAREIHAGGLLGSPFGGTIEATSNDPVVVLSMVCSLVLVSFSSIGPPPSLLAGRSPFFINCDHC